MIVKLSFYKFIIFKIFKLNTLLYLFLIQILYKVYKQSFKQLAIKHNLSKKVIKRYEF